MSLAISLFVTIPVIYSGFKGLEVNQIKLARTFGASKAQILTNARQHSHDDRGAQGQCGFMVPSSGSRGSSRAGDSLLPVISGQLIRSSCVCANCVSRQSRSRDQQKAEPV
jgi:hypothetical protein